MNQIKKALCFPVFLLWASTGQAENVKRLSEEPELAGKAHKLKLTVDIDVPIDHLWSVVGVNFDKSVRFNPAAVHTVYIDDRGTGPDIGSRRRTLDVKGRYIDVEITEFLQDNHYVAWEIICTDVAKMEVAYSSYKLEEIDSNKTRITQEAGFALSNPIMQLAGKQMFPKIFLEELAVLKHTLENDVAKDDLSTSEYKKRYFPLINVNVL